MCLSGSLVLDKPSFSGPRRHMQRASRRCFVHDPSIVFLGMVMSPAAYQTALQYLSGQLLFTSSYQCVECHHSVVSDVMGDHDIGCSGADRLIRRHNALRDAILTSRIGRNWHPEGRRLTSLTSMMIGRRISFCLGEKGYWIFVMTSRLSHPWCHSLRLRLASSHLEKQKRERRISIQTVA